MSSPDDLQRFITASFRSVWSLELLLLLKRESGPLQHADLVVKLRASDLVVTQALEGLVAGGLAVIDTDGQVSFMPASPDLARSIDDVEALYARKPDAVRRMIIDAGRKGLTAFSNAFLLRKD